VRPLGTEADEVARVARNARDITSSTVPHYNYYVYVTKKKQIIFTCDGLNI
jgi:predicted Abi (CAAX) family protease